MLGGDLFVKQICFSARPDVAGFVILFHLLLLCINTSVLLRYGAREGCSFCRVFVLGMIGSSASGLARKSFINPWMRREDSQVKINCEISKPSEM
jgi:hypothetical protein